MDTILDQAQRGTPVIVDEGVTFVWQGDQPPQLIGDLTD